MSKDSKSKPKQKKAANGYAMALQVPLGEVLTDVGKEGWVIGPPIGQGGFGTIYSGIEFVNLYLYPKRPHCTRSMVLSPRIRRDLVRCIRFCVPSLRFECLRLCAIFR